MLICLQPASQLFEKQYTYGMAGYSYWWRAVRAVVGLCLYIITLWAHHPGG
jgi:hypothetical protein